ncbi:TPA: methyltransferase domain-containing protein [Candidatus Poribacteria bacterium]|nr:methyltransferase domain-containing protein [Candidatus Poribacteria bacterium]
MMNRAYQIYAILRERQFVFATEGGLSLPKNKIEAGIELLVETMEVKEDDSILDLNCGYGAIGIVAAAAAPRGNVTLTTPDIRAVQLAQQNIKRNRLLNAEALLADEPGDEDEVFDVILMWHAAHLGKDFCFEMIQKSKRCLKMGGAFYIAIKTKKGAKSVASFMERIYGNVETVEKSQGYRILKSIRKPDAGEEIEESYEYQITTELLGKSYTFQTRPGVFSRKKIDAGTLLLIETMNIRESDTVLDLGCGYGPLGVVASHIAHKGEVFLVDTNIRAIRCARHNIAANGCHNARAYVSDGFEAVNGIDFDVICSNPPTHSGKDVILPFIRGSYRQLKSKGQIFLVVAKPQMYLKMLQQTFGNAEIIRQSERYTVISAVKTRRINYIQRETHYEKILCS